MQRPTPSRTTVKVSSRHQIVIPSVARKELDIEAGDRLLVDVQNGSVGRGPPALTSSLTKP